MTTINLNEYFLLWAKAHAKGELLSPAHKVGAKGVCH